MCEQIPVGELGDADLNREITAVARTEAAAAGRRFAAVAELATRRLGSEVARFRERWAADAMDSVAAEVASDLVITHRQAVAMIYQALDLQRRIALIGDLLRDGSISERVATTASWRTHLIEDPELLARVDADIAEVAIRWGGYGQQRLNDAIDARIERHDPDAVRRFRQVQKQLNVQFGKLDDETGTRTVFGRMSALNAEVSERRIMGLIEGVCPNDPRTIGGRRDDAWGVIAAGGDLLPCLCGNDDCTATGPDARGRLFDILVLTDDPDAGTGTVPESPPAPDPDPDVPVDPRIDDRDYDMSQHWYDDEPPADDEDAPPDDERAEPLEPAAKVEPVEPVAVASPGRAECAARTTVSTPDTPAPAAPCGYTTIIAGGRILPAALLADLRRMGATVRTVAKPADLMAEPGYRPSVALQRMIRARDMTCRFTGCDRPAEYCDIDHTIPYADSRLTHPGNTKVLCRKHHLLKTFWVGRGGWTDKQLPDGTVVWTSPSGIEHRAPPGSRIFFPDWDTTTPLPAGPPVVLNEVSPHRGLRMPARRRTRAQQRAANIRAERRRNRETRDANPAPF